MRTDKNFFRKNTENLKHNTAFTLAEVLVTLGIIGVVAALTIPSLMRSINNSENIAALKKNYSVLSQATILIKNDNDGTLSGLCSSDSNCLINLYKAKLSVIQSCLGSPVGSCWQAYLPDPFAAYAAAYTPAGGLALANGVFIGFTAYANCNDNTDGLASCARIDIDVNGKKGKKTDGSDIFGFHLTSTGLVPFGSSDGKLCNGTDNSGCATRYILGGDPVTATVPPPPPPCTPLPSETRTSTPCPTGQTGTITERRTSSCPGPTWSSWSVISNTCTTPPPTCGGDPCMTGSRCYNTNFTAHTMATNECCPAAYPYCE